MVSGESRDPQTGEILEGHGKTFGNLYKMYLIQAGCVVFPVFFIWMLTKRERVEEVQIVLHHREHHSRQHPDEKRIGLKELLIQLRLTRSVRATVHNDFRQFAEVCRLAQSDQRFDQQRRTRDLNDFYNENLSTAHITIDGLSNETVRDYAVAQFGRSKDTHED